MCFPVRSSILTCLNTEANSEGYLSKEFIEVDRQKYHLLLSSRVTQTMDLFDHKTIHFERGPCLAFQQIEKICHRNKHPKIYVRPLLESSTHRVPLVLIKTAKTTGRHAEKRDNMGKIPFMKKGHNVIKHASFNYKHLSKIALFSYRFYTQKLCALSFQNTKPLLWGLFSLYVTVLYSSPCQKTQSGCWDIMVTLILNKDKISVEYFVGGTILLGVNKKHYARTSFTKSGSTAAALRMLNKFSYWGAEVSQPSLSLTVLLSIFVFWTAFGLRLRISQDFLKIHFVVFHMCQKAGLYVWNSTTWGYLSPGKIPSSKASNADISFGCIKLKTLKCEASKDSKMWCLLSSGMKSRWEVCGWKCNLYVFERRVMPSVMTNFGLC